jgi:nucleotide-binding universal stress UspA family protein
MKQILVPIDFSKNAINALNYAIGIAKTTHARLTLLNISFSPQLAALQPSPLLPTADELREQGLKDLEKLRKRLEKKYGSDLQITCHCVTGFPVDEIRLFAEKHKTDLIVIGTQGVSYIEERFLGSTATSLIAKACCPVLAVDITMKFKVPGRILLAADFVETRSQVLKPLKQLAEAADARIYILNIVTDPVTSPSINDMVNGYKLSRSLKNIHHTFFYLHRQDVIAGLNEFISEHRMDMIVMIPRRHSFFSRILTEPRTRRMVFHSKVPLLTLHDQH